MSIQIAHRFVIKVIADGPFADAEKVRCGWDTATSTRDACVTQEGILRKICEILIDRMRDSDIL